MCEYEVLEVISTCILHTEEEEVLFLCAGTLCNISEHPKARKQLWDVQIVDSLVKMAQYLSIRLQSQDVRAFTFIFSIIADGQNRNMILKVMEASILIDII